MTGAAKPRVLYVGAGNPWAGGAGFLVRQRLLLDALCEIADVHAAMFNWEGTIPGGVVVTAVPSPRRAAGSRWRMLAADVLSPMPRTLRGYNCTGPRGVIESLRPDEFDAVFAYRIDFAFFAGVLGRPKLLLDIDDPEHLRVGRRLAVHFERGGDWRTRLDLRKLRRFEHRAAAGARWASVCQANDARGWRVPVHVVPNCVEVPAAAERAVGEPTLLFVGNCAGGEHSPNADAVKWLLQEIWPAVLAAVPGARLQIVGATSERVRGWAAAVANVQLLGFVDDLAAVYARASASVAPIRFGTGTRIKILEAFAHGVPVVSTGLGIEGIEATVGGDYLLGDTAAAFAEGCVRLLTDAAARERVGAAGRGVALRRYDRRSETRRLAGQLREVLGA